MSRTTTTVLGLVLLLAGACQRGDGAADRCDDVADEASCRRCCQQVDASGATWVDSECACLPAR